MGQVRAAACGGTLGWQAAYGQATVTGRPASLRSWRTPESLSAALRSLAVPRAGLWQ